jgi:hypothetical protein
MFWILNCKVFFVILFFSTPTVMFIGSHEVMNLTNQRLPWSDEINETEAPMMWCMGTSVLSNSSPHGSLCFVKFITSCEPLFCQIHHLMGASVLSNSSPHGSLCFVQNRGSHDVMNLTKQGLPWGDEFDKTEAPMRWWIWQNRGSHEVMNLTKQRLPWGAKIMATSGIVCIRFILQVNYFFSTSESASTFVM